MDDLILQTAKKLATAQKVVISTGAGVSRESGVPTFRDAMEGLWAKYDPTELATPEAFAKNPKLVWDFYLMRRHLVEDTVPNAGHYALAELERILPKVVLVTQNVDNHHQTAGSKDIIALHGSLFAYKCSENCQGTPTAIDFDSLAPWNEADAPPPCPHCGVGKVRPDVVWFNELLPEANLRRAKQEAKSCDVMLVVGTSGMVYPAAWLPIEAAAHGAFTVEVNPNPSELTPRMDVFLAAPSGQVLPKVVEAVKQELGLQ